LTVTLEFCGIDLILGRSACRNPRGACEIYHYNSDGTLDWGYFQINTVHLKRNMKRWCSPGLSAGRDGDQSRLPEGDLTGQKLPVLIPRFG
jgi:hypothetical protein